MSNCPRWIAVLAAAASVLAISVAARTSATAQAAAPTVTSLAPSHGAYYDPPLVAISGTGFTSGSSVTFGADATAEVDVRSSTLIYARPPTLPTGTVDVRVSTTDGHSPVSASDEYTAVTFPTEAQTDQVLGFGAVFPNPTTCWAADACRVFGDRHMVAFRGEERGPQRSVPEVMGQPHCTSATFCAGLSANQAWVFDGNHWTSSQPLDADALSCTGPSFCIAIGRHQKWWRYSGSHWVAGANGPGPVGDPYIHTQDVSCVTATFCIAVDSTGDSEGDTDATRLYRFDGTSWTRVRTSNGLGGDVSCASATLCVAETGVGLEKWNGKTWSVVGGSHPALAGIIRCFTGGCMAQGCPGASNCHPRFEHLLRWNYSTWTDLGQIPNSGLAAATVGCGSTTTCRTVTDLDYSRRWSASGGFGRGMELGDRLYNAISVSCAPNPFCMAVSTTGRIGIYDDGAWLKAVTVDDVGSPTAVACPPDGPCVVVDDAGYAVTVTRSGFASSTKRIDTAPLIAVSCGSTEFCVAVDDQSRVVRFQDVTWHTPTPRAPAGSLREISCVANSFCMAVGHGYVTRYLGAGQWTAAERIGAYAGNVSCPTTTYCLVGVHNGVRVWGGQALSPEFRWFDSHNVYSLSCATTAWCLVAAQNDPVHPDETTYTNLDGTAWSSTTTGGSLDQSCWQPQRCFLIGTGDHQETTEQVGQ